MIESSSRSMSNSRILFGIGETVSENVVIALGGSHRSADKSIARFVEFARPGGMPPHERERPSLWRDLQQTVSANHVKTRHNKRNEARGNHLFSLEGGLHNPMLRSNGSLCR
jgi:hypothetical protein